MVSVSVFLAYLLTARGLRNVFPFSVFDMYEMRSPLVTTRLLVLDSNNQTTEIRRFESFQCEPKSPDIQTFRVCGEGAQMNVMPYVARDLQILLDARLGDVSSGEEVTLIARTWRLQDRPGPSPFSDCALARCRARRAP